MTFPDADTAWFRVLKIQTKLHQWAREDSSRRFNDLFNLVCDPGFLAMAWDRVRNKTGARTAGVDGQTAFCVETVRGREAFLAELRAELKTGPFSPVPVRERMIPKPGGKLRRLGIPTVRDRVVQAALKLVLEPIFEVDFTPCSYGFRPKCRAQDAIAEIHFLASAPRNDEWVLEADIEACFDCIDHTALLGASTLTGLRQADRLHTYPPKKAPASIASKVKTISRQNVNQPLAASLHRLAPVLRGWVNYLRHGTPRATFDYPRHYTWRRVIIRLRTNTWRAGCVGTRTSGSEARAQLPDAASGGAGPAMPPPPR